LRNFFSESDSPDKELQSWTITETDNTVLLSNRIAFMDRLREMPMASFLELDRHFIQNYKGFGNPPQVNYEALSSYCKATTPQQNAFWRAIGSARLYRGINMYYFSSAYALVTLWEGLSQANKDKLMIKQQPDEPAELSLARLSLKTQQRFLSALRGFGSEYSASWNPSYARYLATCTLRVWPDGKGAENGRGTFGLSLDAPGNPLTPRRLISSQLPLVPVTVPPP
jgi:hypothetical protein